MKAEAEELLRRLTGRSSAAFRPGQWEAIERLVERRARVLVVQRTGWGKSAVYLLATRLLRDRGAGPTVLISPLLALMRNQIQMAERGGICAVTINSSNREEWEEIEQEVRAGAVDILLISPERLNNLRFRREVLPALTTTVGLVVVDEAHCISDWGHDFRPDYRRIASIVRLLPAGVPVLCTTATANDRVVADISRQLGESLEIIRGPLDRTSLALAVIELPAQAMRLAWLASVIPILPGSGIVYCLTVRDTERVARWLHAQGIDAVAYSGDSNHEDRLASEEALLGNNVKVVVATSALGMGFDKPDLSFVIHYQGPSSAVAYYQQVGRAGRAVDPAYGILLRGAEDADIQDFFIRTAFPPRQDAEAIVNLLDQSPGTVSVGQIEQAVNARRSRIEAMLKVLEVEGAVERDDHGWARTLQPWVYDDERVRTVTSLRRAEQAAMNDYAATSGCRMAFLRNQLDDLTATGCGRCDNCAGSRWDLELPDVLVSDAATHLRQRALVIEPRQVWPPGSEAMHGRIPSDVQLEAGRALSAYGDGGWGGAVRRAKYSEDRYSDELLDAAVALIRRWRPTPWPSWATSVPSSSARGHVPDFARRLASALDLEFVEAVRRVALRPPQKEMENSAQQFRNVQGAFELTGTPPPSPVLLIDDIVDSRWTLTVIGVQLREAGSGPVHPFVLAQAVSS